MKATLEAFESVLKGTAVGDSLGLPAEGMSPGRIARRWPGPWKQRFFAGGGMVSDDTEHSVFVAQCLIQSPGDADRFQGLLAWRLKWWLCCLPAGVGLATLRAILKLWLGFSPERSGVYSAGNGPAMRSAVIGVFFSEDEESLREYVKRSTCLTHTDPRAEIAALAVALTAAESVGLRRGERPDTRKMLDLWQRAGEGVEEWRKIVGQMEESVTAGRSVAGFAETMGLAGGVSGYAFHSVPVALYAWLIHCGDFRKGLESVLNCGGDTDTVGAITGALLALGGDIPGEWLENLRDCPISQNYLNGLAKEMTGAEAPRAPFLWPLLPVRNLGFLFIVLGHGFRRLVPV